MPASIPRFHRRTSAAPKPAAATVAALSRRPLRCLGSKEPQALLDGLRPRRRHGPLASNPTAPPARPRLYPAVVPSGAEPVGKTFQVRMHRRFNCEGCHGIRSRPNRCWLSNPGRSNPKPVHEGEKPTASPKSMPTRPEQPVTKQCTNTVASQLRSNRGLTGQCAGAKVGSMLRQVRQVGLLVVVVRGDAAVGSCRT